MKSIICSLAAALTFAPAISNAEIFSCPGSVSYLGVFDDGRLAANWGYGYFVLCNLNAPAGGSTAPVQPSTCKVYYAQLLSAKVTGKPINVVFDTAHGRTSSTPATSCAALSGHQWSYPNPGPYQLQQDQ